MKLYSSFIFLLLLILSLSSCSRSIARIFPERPDRSFKFDDDVSVEFKQGWEDGCEVGMADGSNAFYQMFYRNNKVDGYKMAGSGDYKTAWSQAFWFCYRHDYVKQKEGTKIWSSMFGGYK